MGDEEGMKGQALSTKTARLILVGAVAALALSSAAVGASDASIDETGPDSYNKVEFDNHFRTRVTNNNNASATNNNPQSASTGDAKVKHNTTGGDATSGDASNESNLDVSYNVDNSGGNWVTGWDGLDGVSGDISNTGPDSRNKIEFDNNVRITVSNNNNLSVTNNNSQTASTGDARVSGNTTGGDATSGNASNTSNTTIEMEVTN